MKVAPPSRQRLARLIAQIHASGETASFWAERCGWIPGSGHCHIGAIVECREQCLFAALREAEAAKICRLRQQRRRPQPVSD